MIARFRKEFEVSASDAKRLAVTEGARVATEAQRQSLVANGYEEYEYIAEPKACDICKALNGKTFKVKAMEPGLNAAPMHPYCHCSVAAHFSLSDGEELEEKSLKNIGTVNRLELDLDNIQIFAINDKQAILDKIASGEIDAELFYSRKFAFDEIFKGGVQTPIQRVYNRNDAYYHIINRHVEDWFTDKGTSQIVKTLQSPNSIYETTDFFGNKAKSYFRKNDGKELMVVVRNGIITAYKPSTNYVKKQKSKGVKIYDSKN